MFEFTFCIFTFHYHVRCFLAVVVFLLFNLCLVISVLLVPTYFVFRKYFLGFISVFRCVHFSCFLFSFLIWSLVVALLLSFALLFVMFPFMFLLFLLVISFMFLMLLLLLGFIVLCLLLICFCDFFCFVVFVFLFFAHPTHSNDHGVHDHRPRPEVEKTESVLDRPVG